jgi:hypothetical protein
MVPIPMMMRFSSSSSSFPLLIAGRQQAPKIMRCAGATGLRGFYLCADLLHKVCFLQVLYNDVPLHVAKRIEKLAARMAPVFNSGQSRCLLEVVTHKSIAS